MTTLPSIHAAGNVQPVINMMDLIILVLDAQYSRLNYIFKVESVFITALNYQLSVLMHHAHHVP